MRTRSPGGFRLEALAFSAALGAIPGCGAAPANRLPVPVAAAPTLVATEPRPAPAAVAATEVQAKPDPRAQLVAWLRERLPPGGSVVDAPGAAVRILHTARDQETYQTIADGYLGLTQIYAARDLQKAILDTNRIPEGARVRPGDRLFVPAVITAPFKSADEERLGWPEDKTLRGIYIRGSTAGSAAFVEILDRMAQRDMNLIVLDTKDYDGLVTYPSRVAVAVDAGATKSAPIRDLARAIRFAHARGVRVAMRVSCFEDELVAKAKGSLSVQSVWGRPYRIGWLDPSNEEAQQYLIDLAKEAIDAGADEIELDYVRYPVLGIADADFHLKERKLVKTVVIRDFVRKMHAATSPRNVPLSLDVFGAIAEGHREDIEMLGQDPVLLAPECEVLSPMVYPSHYAKGFHGFEIPGNHPELVGIGVKGIIEQIRRGGVRGGAIIRPWLQAIAHHSPEYGPQYVASEIKQAGNAGALGWLMWNPAQVYSVTWSAVPVVKQ